MSKRQTIISAILGYLFVGIILAIFAPKFFLLLIPIICLDLHLSQKHFNIFGKDYV